MKKAVEVGRRFTLATTAALRVLIIEDRLLPPALNHAQKAQDRQAQQRPAPLLTRIYVMDVAHFNA